MDQFSAFSQLAMSLAALGIRHITILPRGHSEGGRSRMDTVRSFAEHVMPKFR
jgi:hypothetical protein